MSSSKILYLRVKTQSEKLLNFKVFETDTVETLKELIGKKEGLPISYQTLYFNGITLENDKPLIHYGLTNDDTLNLHIPLRGTGGTRISAPDVNKQATKKTGKNDLFYWNVKCGCNYGGTCKNKTCKAVDQPVMYCRGTGAINPFEDEHMDEIVRCPGCKERFEVDGYYFYKCKVEIKYKKYGDKELTKMPAKRVEGEDYWQLGGDEKEKVDYICMKFIVTKL